MPGESEARAVRRSLAVGLVNLGELRVPRGDELAELASRPAPEPATASASDDGADGSGNVVR